MAYLDHNHSHKRLAGITGVALVHVVLAAGLTAGLAINYTQDKPEDVPDVTLIPIPQPLPTETPEIVDPVEDRIVPPTAPDRPVDLTTLPPLPPTPPVPPSETTPIGGGQLVLPPSTAPTVAPQPPLVTPRGPVPANGPAGWVTTEDYPRIAISREYEGTVRYQVTVDGDGRVQTCSVIASSGHDVLDQAACRRIEGRARFRPGIDRNGAEVGGTYTGSVSWQLPD